MPVLRDWTIFPMFTFAIFHAYGVCRAGRETARTALNAIYWWPFARKFSRTRNPSTGEPTESVAKVRNALGAGTLGCTKCWKLRAPVLPSVVLENHDSTYSLYFHSRWKCYPKTPNPNKATSSTLGPNPKSDTAPNPVTAVHNKLRRHVTGFLFLYCVLINIKSTLTSTAECRKVQSAKLFSAWDSVSQAVLTSSWKKVWTAVPIIWIWPRELTFKRKTIFNLLL